jgi:hypothetical protein
MSNHQLYLFIGSMVILGIAAIIGALGLNVQKPPRQHRGGSLYSSKRHQRTTPVPARPR